MNEQYRKTVADCWLERQNLTDIYADRMIPDPKDAIRASDIFTRWREAWGSSVVLRLGGIEPLLSAARSCGRGEFPACIPPWPQTAIEFDRFKLGRISVLLETREDRQIYASIWLEAKGHVDGPLAECEFTVDGNGSVHAAELEDRLNVWFATDRVPSDDVRNALGQFLALSLVGISIANCRNAERVEMEPPERLNRRHLERKGRPLFRYYVLNIAPVRKILEQEGGLGENSLGVALHLCRGHFKDFREGGGLFGRHKGLYWWDAAVRGSVKHGVVAKDYALTPSAKPEARTIPK